jgi:hypothetical protein
MEQIKSIKDLVGFGTTLVSQIPAQRELLSCPDFSYEETAKFRLEFQFREDENRVLSDQLEQFNSKISEEETITFDLIDKIAEIQKEISSFKGNRKVTQRSSQTGKKSAFNRVPFYAQPRGGEDDSEFDIFVIRKHSKDEMLTPLSVNDLKEQDKLDFVGTATRDSTNGNFSSENCLPQPNIPPVPHQENEPPTFTSWEDDSEVKIFLDDLDLLLTSCNDQIATTLAQRDQREEVNKPLISDHLAKLKKEIDAETTLETRLKRQRNDNYKLRKSVWKLDVEIFDNMRKLIESRDSAVNQLQKLQNQWSHLTSSSSKNNADSPFSLLKEKEKEELQLRKLVSSLQDELQKLRSSNEAEVAKFVTEINNLKTKLRKRAITEKQENQGMWNDIRLIQERIERVLNGLFRYEIDPGLILNFDIMSLKKQLARVKTEAEAILTTS